ncbi:ComEA family DNA-binding protein [Singulisphaera rosea]
MNINTASLAELEALPGIGKTLARRIGEGRPCRAG